MRYLGTHPPLSPTSPLALERTRAYGAEGSSYDAALDGLRSLGTVIPPLHGSRVARLSYLGDAGSWGSDPYGYNSMLTRPLGQTNQQPADTTQPATESDMWKDAFWEGGSAVLAGAITGGALGAAIGESGKRGAAALRAAPVLGALVAVSAAVGSLLVTRGADELAAHNGAVVRRNRVLRASVVAGGGALLLGLGGWALGAWK